ncbi:MAG TPA: porin, partial [Hydrogenothermaceae bacterium]|nr:porin [Hydrogenothermaceae bacterium]
MKKLVGLAAAGLLTAGAVQAGNLTVANSDIVLYGGISAGAEYANTDLGAINAQPRKLPFRLYNVAIGLMKKADANNSPIGFNLAFAYFYVPTVVASADTV